MHNMHLCVHSNKGAIHPVVITQVILHSIAGHHGMGCPVSMPKLSAQIRMHAHTQTHTHTYMCYRPPGDQLENVNFYYWSPTPLQCPHDASQLKHRCMDTFLVGVSTVLLITITDNKHARYVLSLIKNSPL